MGKIEGVGHEVFLPLPQGLAVGSEGLGSLEVRGGLPLSPSCRPVLIVGMEVGAFGLVAAWMGRSGL
jgi:hypothetical protein